MMPGYTFTLDVIGGVDPAADAVICTGKLSDGSLAFQTGEGAPASGGSAGPMTVTTQSTSLTGSEQIWFEVVCGQWPPGPGALLPLQVYVIGPYEVSSAGTVTP